MGQEGWWVGSGQVTQEGNILGSTWRTWGRRGKESHFPCGEEGKEMARKPWAEDVARALGLIWHEP